MRTSALVRVTTALTAVLIAVSLIAGPAAADEPPPVVVPDTVTLYPGESTTINVLANDTSPTGDDLALCRFPVSDLFTSDRIPAVLVVENSLIFGGKPGRLDVTVMPRAHGTHVIDYYVCDHTHLVPATLTIVVRQTEPVDVSKVRGRPGLLRVTNHNDRSVVFLFGDPRADEPDGQRRILAGDTRTVQVQRHRIVWIAMIGVGKGKAAGLGDSGGIAGLGIVRDIKLDEKPLPKPKQPDYEVNEDILGRWR